MDSASWIYLIMATYFLLIWLGPKYMKYRPAFNIKGILIAYNSIQALANLGIGIYVSVS